MSALVTPARPLPVTIAIRAQVNCTAVIIGKVMSAVHNAPNPNDAPATAYVPMPEGSSSDAQVINPGPRIINNRESGFDLTIFLDGLLIYVYRGETNKEMAKARVCRGPGSSRESKQQGSLTLVYIGLLLNNPRRSNCSRDETTSSLSVLIQNPQPQFHSSVSTDLIVAKYQLSRSFFRCARRAQATRESRQSRGSFLSLRWANIPNFGCTAMPGWLRSAKGSKLLIKLNPFRVPPS